MAHPHPQLEAAPAKFAGPPGVMPDQAAQLRVANPNPVQPRQRPDADVADMTPSKFTISMLALLALSACAHTPSEPIPSQRSSAMTTPLGSADTQNPKLSAEEIGKRFLKLIKGLRSRDDLSLERIREVVGISLTLEPGDLSAGVWSHDLGGGWRYAFTYVPESPSLLEGVGLSFQDRGDGFSDMTPVCTLDFEYYHYALVEMGFMAEPYYGEHNLLLDWRYTKFKKDDGAVDMTISIAQMAGNEPGHMCVKSIGTLNGR